MKLATALLILLAALLSGGPVATAQIHFDDFNSLEGITMVGDAVARNEVLQLTPALKDRAGAIWINRLQLMEKGFITRFQFRIKDTLGQPDATGRAGGDGIAFVLHNTSAGANAIGGTGGYIGYGLIGATIAVEFDTYLNSDSRFGDPNGNHISVQVGSARHLASLGADQTIPNLSDGRIHTATIEYFNGTLSVYIDACAPIRIAVDVVLPETAWVGLTSSTGAAWQSHEIISWHFNPLGIDRNFRGQPCDADAVTLTVRGDHASYFWSTGETTKSITVNRTGTYNVRVADTNGCSALTYAWDERVDLGATGRPRLSRSGPADFCAGDSVILTAEGDYAQWNWSPTGGNTRSIVARTPGKYFVVAYDSRGCMAISDTIIVTVRPRPSAAVTPSGPLTFCEGGSVMLTADSAATYRWSNGESTRSILVREAGRYSVTVTAGNGCQATSAPIDVVISPMPEPRISIEGRERCSNDSLTLDAGSGYIAYRWSSGETTQRIVARGAGSWSVEVMAAGGCIGFSDTVTILPGGFVSPTITLSGALPFCVGGSVTLGLAQTYASYRWSDGSTGATLVVRQGGTYGVTVVDTAGCEGTASVNIPDPLPAPSVRIIPSGLSTVCEGDSIELTTTPTNAPLHWSTGSTESRIVVRSPGLYRVTVGSGTCVSSDSVTIDFRPRPVAFAGPDHSICVGQTVTLQATGGTSYRWTPADGLSCTDCASPTASPSVTTLYIVEVGNGGSCTAFDTVLVTVDSRGKIDLGPDRTICRGDSIRLGGDEPFGSFLWSPAAGLSCTTCPHPVASPSVTTTYVVTSTGAGSCVGADTITITVDDVGVLFRSSIARGVGAGPGEIATVPVMLETAADQASIDSVDLRIAYNPRISRPDPAMTVQSITSGTLLADWNGSIDVADDDTIVVHLGAPIGRTLLGAGRLVDLRFKLFLGDSTGTELPYELFAYGTRCLTTTTRAGRLDVDSICGLSYRLIEIGTTKYALGEITPNPASEIATISFALGLDAPTTVRVFDLSGVEVGRPIDATMTSGEYQLRIETALLPAGIYFLRLQSGEFVETRRLAVERQ